MAKQTSLPPLVEGRTRGHVSVCVKGPVEWECNVGPPAPKLSIRLKWWGEKGSGMLFRYVSINSSICPTSVCIYISKRLSVGSQWQQANLVMMSGLL